MFEPIRGGTRGGQAEFKWSDVSADKDRENYLGHSINAPTGRWQKNKDVHWYSRDATESEKATRDEEIRKIKELEADALAVALGFEPAQKTAATKASDGNAPSADKDPSNLDAETSRLQEKEKGKEEKRQTKLERREQRRERREERHARRERRALERGSRRGTEYSDDYHARRERSRRSASPRRELRRSPERRAYPESSRYRSRSPSINAGAARYRVQERQQYTRSRRRSYSPIERDGRL